MKSPDTPLKHAMRQQAAAHIPALRFTKAHAADFAAWKQQVMDAVRGYLRIELPPRNGTPPETPAVRVEETVPSELVTRRKIWIRTEPHLEVPAWLHIPRVGHPPFPALLCPHGHGHGKIEIAGLVPSCYGSETNYGAVFALNGYVTLCPDHRGFGELAYERCGADEGWLAWQYHTRGQTLQGRRIHDLFACVSVLASLPEVDPSRIGSAGLSLGGELSFYMALLDERIRCAVSSGIVRDLREEVVDARHCDCSFPPGLFEAVDFPDIAGAVAPKPLLLQAGRRDPFCSPLFGSEGQKRIQSAYAAAGARAQLAFDLHDEAHDFVMEAPLGFLRQHLG